MQPWLAWTIVTLGWLLPLAHITLARGAGSWRPPPGSGCPLGPRVGWLVLVLLAGPLGWLLYHLSRRNAPGSRARS